MKSGIILIGMMGSGKSTVGRALASLLNYPFEDTDQMLEYRLGRHIPQLFKLYGEEAFRSHETAILKGLEPAERVLATGGGIVLKPENWTEFKRLGKTVFLDVSTELLSSRLGQSNRKRPLLQTENWEDKLSDLYAGRRHLYEQAEIIVKVEDNQPIEDVAQGIFEVIRAGQS
ncbi:MAG: shikimate kinase [Fimbriimonadaceae bacterium]|nr:MAG: shikimate kinase [Fimbriimonadaceae bacterium]